MCTILAYQTARLTVAQLTNRTFRSSGLDFRIFTSRQIRSIVSRCDVVIVEFTITGTHDGALKGIPPTGRKLELRGMEKFRVVDGQIQEMHAYFDSQEIPEQFGLTLPAIVGQLPKHVLRKVL